MGRCTPRVWVGRSKLIWVVNLRIVYGYVMPKWKNFYRGGNGAHFRGFLGFGAVASSNLKIFSWDSGYPWVYLLWTYFGQYQLDLDGHNAHGCISGLILHGAVQTQFLGILYHKLSTFMLIRRGAGSFKCYYWIFEQLPWFWTCWTWYKTCARLVFGQLLSDYSIKSLDILTVFRHYWGLIIYKISKHWIE